MRRFVPAALLALALGVVAGCGSSAAPRPSTAALDPANLPLLPSAGVVVQRKHAVELIGLDGRGYGRLPGWTTVGSRRPNAAVTLASVADPSLAFLADPRGRWYVLAGGRLRRFSPPRAPLAAGASLTIRHLGAELAPLTIAVERGGELVLSGLDLQVGGRRLVSRRGVLLDLVTGRRWTTPRLGCVAAGFANGEAFAVCRPSDGSMAPTRLLAYRPKGAPRGLARFPLPAQSAIVSPDGRYVAVNAQAPCGPPWAMIARTRGGGSRFVTGMPFIPGDTEWLSARRALFLGWSPDGKLVANVYRGHTDCERGAAAGAYLIDPHTLARTRISPPAAAFWGP